MKVITMKTKKTSVLLMFIAVGLISMQANAAQVWDIVNNSVTDTRSITFPSTTTISINDILQFNSADAVSAGEAAGTYVLTSVVLDVNVTDMSGTFTFNNTLNANGTITAASFAGSQGVTFTAGANSALQSMTHVFNGELFMKWIRSKLCLTISPPHWVLRLIAQSQPASPLIQGLVSLQALMQAWRHQWT